MTIKDRIDAALHNIRDGNTTARTEAIDALVTAAYWRGKHDGAREACDKAAERYNAQCKAAMECRYYNMAVAVVEAGAKAARYPCVYIYHPDYNGDTAELLGEDDWLGDDKL